MPQIHERIYKKVTQLFPDLAEMKPGDHRKLTSAPYMDLNMNVLESEGGKMVISLAQNYLQNGDVMCDPDMTLVIVFEMKMAEALSFQQDGLPVIGTLYQVVYPKPGYVNMKNKKELNSFLDKWLGNLRLQGFGAAGDKTAA